MNAAMFAKIFKETTPKALYTQQLPLYASYKWKVYSTFWMAANFSSQKGNINILIYLPTLQIIIPFENSWKYFFTTLHITSFYNAEVRMPILGHLQTDGFTHALKAYGLCVIVNIISCYLFSWVLNH